MKTKPFLLLLISLSTLQCYAQESYNLSEFELKSNGFIYITETDSVSGALTYNELASGKVMLTDASGKDKKYTAKEVFSFKTQNPTRTFYSIKTDGLDKSMMFYEDVTPNGGKKLKLMKSFTQDGLVIVNGQVKGKWDNAMYSPSEKRLIGSNFKKVAEVVKDCPALAEKISKKEKGYYFGLMSVPMVQEKVLNNIVTEYNTCQ